MKKRVIAVFLVSTILFGTACGSAGNPQAQTAETQENQQVEEIETEEMDPTEALLEEGKDYYYARNGQELDYKKAMEIFQQAADAGNAEGWYYVGKTYLTDDFRFLDNTDYSKSIDAFEKALDMGCSLAGVALGDIYREGVIDYDRAKQYYHQAVDAGCVEGNYGLGVMSHNGNGMDRSVASASDAKKYLTSATEGEEPEYVVKAYDELAKIEEYGRSYENGFFYDLDNEEGREIDYAIIIDDLEKANELCTWDGSYLAYLQSAYEKSGDAEKAEEYKNQFLAWCDEAVNSENPRYLCSAGDVYGSARYIDQDDTKRFDYYMKAADAGDADAMHEVGVMYGDGTGTEQSFELASEWIQTSADCGDTEAMNDLGFLYSHGYGVEQDPSLAMDYFTKAADLGNGEALTNLGYAYLKGNGVAQDYDQAKEWYQKACELNNAVAMYQLGYMCENGLGYSQEGVENSLLWYEKAASKGNVDAMLRLAAYYANGQLALDNPNYSYVREFNESDRNLEMSCEWAKKALAVAEQNHDESSAEKASNYIDTLTQAIEELNQARSAQ